MIGIVSKTSHLLVAPPMSMTSTGIDLAASVTPAPTIALPAPSLLAFRPSLACLPSSPSAAGSPTMLEPNISEVANDGFEAALNNDTKSPALPNLKKTTPLKGQELFSSLMDDTPASVSSELVGDFSHFEVLKKSMDQHANRAGFIAAKNSKDYINQKLFSELYPGQPYTKVHRRGFFYCSHKSANREKGVQCSFHISYILNLSSLQFNINEKLSCFSHNHSCGCHLDQMEGKKLPSKLRRTKGLIFPVNKSR